MKRIQKVLITILALLIITLYALYDVFLVEPQKYKTRYETLQSELIPTSMNDVTLLYFTDLEFGTFVGENRLQKLVNQINDVGADVVIFGGDLVGENVVLSDEQQTSLTSLLSQVKAPLGKFAVYGDNDERNTETLVTVDTILKSSGFEILNNQSISIRNKTSDSISLVGINSGMYSSQNITEAYASVSHSNYVISVCHTPDTADFVPEDLTNYFLSGHSHGGQLFWFFGAYYSPVKAEQHFRGKDRVSGFTVDISNGTGTTGIDARLFAGSEIVVYRLKSTLVEEVETIEPTEITPVETSTPEATAEPTETEVPEIQEEDTSEDAIIIPEEDVEETPIEDEENQE